MSEQPTAPNGVLRYRVERLEKKAEDMDARLERVSDKIDRLILAVVAASLTVAGSVVIFALTVLWSRGR